MRNPKQKTTGLAASCPAIKCDICLKLKPSFEITVNKNGFNICKKCKPPIYQPVIPEGDSFYSEYCREFQGAGAEQ